MSTDECRKAFEMWALPYLHGQYSFYNADTIKSMLDNSTGRTLWDAWQAARAPVKIDLEKCARAIDYAREASLANFNADPDVMYAKAVLSSIIEQGGAIVYDVC